MQFKIDENLPSSVVEIFTERSFDCHTVYDEKIQGIDDNDLIKIANKEKRILVTLDLDFSNITNYPPGNYHGIIVLHPHRQDIKTILKLLEKVLRVVKSETIDRKLWLVESHRIRIKGDNV